MLFESDKVMFEIYRETGYTGQFRVVYFTELQDHNKETEINHAMAGEHFFDGFIKNFGKDEAKEIIEGLLSRLNGGERFGRNRTRAGPAPGLRIVCASRVIPVFPRNSFSAAWRRLSIRSRAN